MNVFVAFFTFCLFLTSCGTTPISKNEIEHAPTMLSGPQLFPVDESQDNPSFAKFKAEFDQAIETKDADWIIAHLDENVWSSFGGDGGVDEFIEHYKLREPDSFFWEAVNTAFELGGAFREIQGDQRFVAPYVFARFPGEYDAFFYSAVIVPNALMYFQPNDDADVVGVLKYSVVKTAFKEDRGEKHENGFQKIETTNGLPGWVREEYIRSPLEHRIGIKQVGDEWKITFLVEGD